jgi:L-amino acid N-acyltransferase YncA
MGMVTEVRPARPEDAARIAAIYNQGIQERQATFETDPRTAADVERWFGDGLTMVVVVAEGDVVAWASAGPYRPRAAYRGVRECSVYVAREARGQGHGRAALEGLAGACAARGDWKLVSRVFPENLASRALCRAAGFREVGTYRRHGRLDGKWRDCVIVERLIGEAAEP